MAVRPKKVKVLVTQPCPALCNPMAVVHRAPLSMGFSRQEYWSGLPFPSPGDLPDPGIEPGSSVLQVGSLPLYHLGSRENLGACFSSYGGDAESIKM